MADIKRPDLDKLRIFQYPESVLRKPAVVLPDVDSFVSEASHRMGELMVAHGGIGLAAPQVGWSCRLVVINPTMEENKGIVLVNPVIVERRGRVVEEEGCLSVPEIRAKVSRAEYVKVRARLLNGEDIEMEGEGLLARLLQHELDHLDGRLFVDRVGAVTRPIIERRLKKLGKKR